MEGAVEPMSERNEYLEQTIVALDMALYRIANGRDCDYFDTRDRPSPCNCPVCVARSTLERVKDWRYLGAHQDRVTSGHNPRETKIHAAWKELLDDRKLAMILDQEIVPSARDWYVATSVVRWLATNVGMTVLEAAGFKYQQWEQDTANRELMRRRQDREKEKKSPVPDLDARQARAKRLADAQGEVLWSAIHGAKQPGEPGHIDPAALRDLLCATIATAYLSGAVEEHLKAESKGRIMLIGLTPPQTVASMGTMSRYPRYVRDTIVTWLVWFGPPFAAFVIYAVRAF
jgi:hypothetical protein